MRGGQLIDGTYNESLGLDVDYIDIINRVRTRFDELEDEDVQAKIDEQRRLYERRRAA
jgi:hypothetical protein